MVIYDTMRGVASSVYNFGANAVGSVGSLLARIPAAEKVSTVAGKAFSALINPQTTNQRRAQIAVVATAGLAVAALAYKFFQGKKKAE